MTRKKSSERDAARAAKIQAKADDWRNQVNAHFGYLQDKYGFRLTQVDAEHWYQTRAIYQTGTTAIYVDASVEFARTEVWLVCLLKEALPVVESGKVGHAFLLDDLLKVRVPHLLIEMRAATSWGKDGQSATALEFLARVLDEYAADVLRGDFSIFVALTGLVEKRVQKARRRQQEEQNVPKELQTQFREITQFTDIFCWLYLTEAYADLCSQLTATLCQKHPSPLSQGRTKAWACSIIYTLGMVNSLFDTSQTPHITEGELESYFELSSSTIRAKSKQIRDLLDAEGSLTFYHKGQ